MKARRLLPAAASLAAVYAVYLASGTFQDSAPRQLQGSAARGERRPYVTGVPVRVPLKEPEEDGYSPELAAHSPKDGYGQDATSQASLEQERARQETFRDFWDAQKYRVTETLLDTFSERDLLAFLEVPGNLESYLSVLQDRLDLIPSKKEQLRLYTEEQAGRFAVEREALAARYLHDGQCAGESAEEALLFRDGMDAAVRRFTDERDAFFISILDWRQLQEYNELSWRWKSNNPGEAVRTLMSGLTDNR